MTKHIIIERHHFYVRKFVCVSRSLAAIRIRRHSLWTHSTVISNLNLSVFRFSGDNLLADFFNCNCNYITGHGLRHTDKRYPRLSVGRPTSHLTCARTI